MLESIEIRRVKNGFVVAVHTEDGEEEFVFDTERKTFKFIRERFSQFAN
jgi:hypothetical protein